MATIKVKFRPSTTVGKEGSIYYQVIHERRPRQISTEYKVFPYEWNDRKATVTCSSSSSRLSYILSVREQIKMDLERIGRVIQDLDKNRLQYTSDEIVEEYERVIEQNSLFGYGRNHSEIKDERKGEDIRDI